MSAKINDMYYAYSAIEDIKEKGEYGGVVTTIMKYLLEEGIVDGVVGVTQGHDIYDGVPTFITDSEDLIETAGSYHFLESSSKHQLSSPRWQESPMPHM